MVIGIGVELYMLVVMLFVLVSLIKFKVGSMLFLSFVLKIGWILWVGFLFGWRSVV